MGTLATITLTAIFSFLVGWGLWHLKKEKKILKYTLDKYGPFPLSKGTGKSFNYKLTNLGNIALENIALKLNIEFGTIVSLEYSENEAFKIIASEEKLVKAEVPLLNPKESVGIMLTIQNELDSSNAKFEARAIGVTAVQALDLPNNSSSDAYAWVFTTVITGVLFGFIGHSIFTPNPRPSVAQSQQVTETEAYKQSPSREIIIFGSFNRAGLKHEFYKLLKETNTDITFWRTGFFIVDQYVSNSKNSDKYIKALVYISESEYIADSSKALLLYLAGKIEKTEGNFDNASKYFELSKGVSPKIYDYLMSQDSDYTIRDTIPNN